MAIEFVAVQEYKSTNAIVNSGIPVGTQDGDVMLAFVANRDSVQTTWIAPPSGWAMAKREGVSATYVREVYYKVANSESGTYAWTASADSPSTAWSVVVAVYRGVDNSDVVDAVGTANNTTNTVINTTVDNAMLVHFMAARGTTSTITPPSGSTQRHNAAQAATGNTSYVLAIADEVLTSATSNVSRTFSASAAAAYLIIVALTPDTGGGSTLFRRGLSLRAGSRGVL